MKNKLAMKLENCIKMVFSINSSFMKSNLVMQQRFLHNGPDTIDELLERHVVKKQKSYNSDEEEIIKHQSLTSTCREDLSLYRDILMATRFFIWPDYHGVLWRDILREIARQEFEEARLKKDPEVITRLLIIGGRDSVQAALDKLVEKQKQELAKEQATRNGQ